MKAFLVALSTAITKKNLDDAIKSCKQKGLDVAYYKTITKKWHQYAGTPKQRVAQLRAAQKSDADVILTVRGGEGCIHILPYIDFVLTKPLVGYSDVTILLNYFFQKYNRAMYHAPNAARILNKKEMAMYFDALQNKTYSYGLSSATFLAKGFAVGIAVGGNLALLLRSLGTPYEVKTNDAILFIEAQSKSPQWIYDTLFQLYVSKKLKDIKAIVLGSFVNCGNYKSTLYQFFKDYDLGVPIVHWPKFGHGTYNYPLRIGSKVTLDENWLTFHHKV